MNLDELASLRTAALAAIPNAESLDALRQIELDHTGKTAPLTLANRELATLDADGKKTFGAAINASRTSVVSRIVSAGHFGSESHNSDSKGEDNSEHRGDDS